MINFLQKNILYIALIQAIVATLSSLYLSEVMRWAPCVLCWYQRILMYPLAIIITIGILRKDKGLALYVLPLSILGALIALYHALLQWRILPEAVAPCVAGVSCFTKHIGWFGFITIPFLSFIAFSVISICLYFYHRNKKYD